jgi:RND family efflux transporter MFP subunit
VTPTLDRRPIRVSFRHAALSLSLALAVLSGCREKAPEAEKAAAAPREVTLASVEQSALERSLEVTGTLAAYDQVKVAVKVPGRLASVSIDLASVVKEGDVIAQIEATDYRLRVDQVAAAVAQGRVQLGLPPEGPSDEVDVEATAMVRQAAATLAEAQANLARARNLAQEGLMTGAERDSAEATFLRAESALQSARDDVRLRQASLRQRRSELKLARQQLADTTVRSPISGVIQQRLANAGEFLAAGAPVAEVVRVDLLRLKLVIPERDAASVKQDQPVKVAVDGDSRAYTGKVARLAPALDPQNRTLLVEADIENPGTLRPGVLARAHVVIGSSPAPTVPASAVVAFAGVEKVLVVDKGKAVEKRVKTGNRIGSRVEIVSGVVAGDKVVEKPGSLQQGQPVTVKAEK